LIAQLEESLLPSTTIQKLQVDWLWRVSTRVTIGLVCLLLAGNAAYASRCARLKARPDAWVAARVDALVRAARGAYERDNAIPAYSKVLDGIAGTIRQCGLAENNEYINRYRAFVEYIATASLDRQPDHELGFLVPDKQYFEETRQFVQIPEFLLDENFMRSVSRFVTLGRAKSFLRRLNS
jgi:hypothetical protein